MSSITVTIKGGGYLSLAFNERETQLFVDSGTALTELMDILSSRFGSPFRESFLDHAGQVDKGIMMFVNRELIPRSKIGTKTLLGNCSIDFVPIVAGG